MFVLVVVINLLYSLSDSSGGGDDDGDVEIGARQRGRYHAEA